MFSKFDFLIPTIFLTVAAAVGTAFFFLKEEDKEVSMKSFIVYSLLSLLAFVLAGLTGFFTIEQPLLFFMGLQVLFFLFGFVHAFALYRLNTWSQPDSLLRELVFTLYINLLGTFGFLIAFALTNRQGYTLVYLSATIFFLLPFMILKCFDLLVSIPGEVYPKWYFPVGQGEIEIPDELFDDDSGIVIVEFRMYKNSEGDSEVIHSRSKLPLKIELGRFFPVFLDQYNDRNPGNLIQYVDENKQPYAWNFYVEPKWWQFKKYINPDTTIRENSIKENHIIVAERV